MSACLEAQRAGVRSRLTGIGTQPGRPTDRATPWVSEATGRTVPYDRTYWQEAWDRGEARRYTATSGHVGARDG